MYSIKILSCFQINFFYMSAIIILNFNIIPVESIYGGKQESISDFPYQVTVQYNNKHYCGGSIIDANTILTAAHCVHGCDYNKFSVRLGNTSHNEGLIYKVAEIIEHPGFCNETLNKDIALLKLDVPLTFTSNVQVIRLQHPGEEIPIKTAATISGWGITENLPLPKNLHATFVYTISSEECQSMHGENKITENMLCTFTPKQDACIGDSGGPLVVDGVQIGIISWGKGCASSMYAGVYTKVAQFYDWIQENQNYVCAKPN